VDAAEPTGRDRAAAAVAGSPPPVDIRADGLHGGDVRADALHGLHGGDVRADARHGLDVRADDGLHGLDAAPVVISSVLAGEVASALIAYIDGLLIAERGRLADGSTAVRVGPLLSLVRALRASASSRTIERDDAGRQMSTEHGPVSAAGHEALPSGLVPLQVWAMTHSDGVSDRTARRWAQAGRLAGAVKVGAMWLVPADAPSPRAR